VTAAGYAVVVANGADALTLVSPTYPDAVVPKRREVDVWRPGVTQPSTTLRVADALKGLDVVPGVS
jgi:hypothetical protein